MSQRCHQLIINSADRINPLITNSNDCRMYVKPAISGFKKVELLSFSMPLTSYNINETNNQIYFNVGGSDYTASITPSSYNICTLIPELKRVMELVSSETFDIWFDNGLFRIVFTISSAADFSFTWETNTTNTSAAILGFTNIDTATLATITSTNAINLSLPLYFYVDIPQFGIHSKSTNSDDSATFIVSSLQNSGGINIFNQFSCYHLLEHFGHNILNTIDVRIKQPGNQLLDIQNSDWSMLIRFWWDDNDLDIGY